ncbi:Pectatelyase [Meloidogyne graminicola]|uniref:pectate lyase n=1 Tax=Meloidogyne graminicola TaxID=189291 RepID=A0A8S9ZX11_9BILA|nr:Pectatelyase [Meloidogyne graminicola]
MGFCYYYSKWWKYNWENVCWRGASFRVAKGFKKTDKTRYTYTVNGGGALDGFQKIFDQSGPGKTIISNFCSVNNAIGIASCGNCGNQYPRDITIQDSKFMGPMLTIAYGNPVDKVTLKNVEIYGENNPTSKITYACSEYMGESVPNPWVNSYKPGQAGGKSCNYAANAVKIMT